MSDEEKPKEQPYDASDQNAIGKRTSEAKRKEAKRLNGFKHLCDSPDGRAWLWWMLGELGFSRTSFSVDPLKMAFMEGQRDVALKLFAQMNKVAPDTYLRMQKENASDE